MCKHAAERKSASACLVCTGLGWRKVYRVQDSSEDDLDPFPFHICNVAMHAAVTCLVYLLAMRLCRERDAPLVSGLWQHRHGDSPFEEIGAGRQQEDWGNRKGAARNGLRHRRSSVSAEHTGPNGMQQKHYCGTPTPDHICLRLAGGVDSTEKETEKVKANVIQNAQQIVLNQIKVLMWQGMRRELQWCGTRQRRFWRVQFSLCTPSTLRLWQA